MRVRPSRERERASPPVRMKAILQRSVERLGDPDVADVADGYARNYLIPRGLAVRAEKGMMRHAGSLKRSPESAARPARGSSSPSRRASSRRRSA